MTASINERKREADSQQRMMEVQAKFKGKNLGIVKPGRLLIKEGLVYALDKGKLKSIYLFLFSDIIMISKKTVKLSSDKQQTLKYDPQSNIDLTSCVLEENIAKLPDVKTKVEITCCFKIIYKGKEQIYVVPEWYDKKPWTDALQKAIKEAK